MPHLSSNILSTNLYGSVFSELFGIARCSLIVNHFIPRASDLFSRMIAQVGNRALTKQLKNTFHRYPTVFQTLGKTR